MRCCAVKKILLIGGGGHCRSVADTLLRLNKYDEIGIVDVHDDSLMFGLIKVVGNDDDLSKLRTEGFTDAFVTVGSVGNTDLRRRLYGKISKLGYNIPNIVDPSAIVSPYAKLGKGIFVGKNATVNAGSEIGDAAIINTGTIVEHECYIGEFVHISPGAVLCGGVEVGDDTHVGANASVKQYIKLGKNVIVGMGSVVIRDVRDNVTVVGNPAHEL